MGASGLDQFLHGLLIDRDSDVPAYYQLEEWLQRRIESGDLLPGTAVPSERELAKRLAMSRMTVRQAMTGLQRDGYLVRRPGSGSVVGLPRLVGSIPALSGISAEVARQGHASSTRVLAVDQLEPPSAIGAALGLVHGVEAIRVRRTRRVDDEPFSIETSWLHPELCAAVLDLDLADRSLNDVLVHQCGLDLASGHERITATTLDPFEADQLTLRAGSPAFRVQRTTWERSGEPVEVVVTVIRGDRFSFEAVLGDHTSLPDHLSSRIGTDSSHVLPLITPEHRPDRPDRHSDRPTEH
jgi:GntR family transcriptional regulator